MSLLLEALKKAELAKKSASIPQEDSLRQDPVITRDTLPDISQPLEIRPNDLPSAEAAISVSEPGEAAKIATPEPSTYATANPTPGFDSPLGHVAETITDRDSNAEQRAAARQVFEAKEMDYNPRRPFYITLGLLALCASGYAGYVWWQLQPRSMYKAQPAGAASSAAPASPQPAPAAAPPAPVAEGTPSQPASGTAPVPPEASRQTAIKAEGAPSSTTRPAVEGNARPTKPAAPARQSPSPSGEEAQSIGSSIAITPQTSMLDPQVTRGYEAFQRGDLVTAREQYSRALQSDPTNRDALLGMAAIDISSRNFESAESRYLKLLEANPRDAYAIAGIMGLRGQTDPVQSESRLKGLIASQPDAAHLHFALGNQYAAQVRWPEAQAAYFKAYTLDPENPDFAFNLAVSLDRLRQSKLALDYYQKAITLAQNRISGFDRNQAMARIAELAR